MQFLVPARFNGPPESGNGGWTAGHAAHLLEDATGAAAVTVRLRTPPPLDRQLKADLGEGDAPGLSVRDGDHLVLEASSAAPLDQGGRPDPVSFATAERAGLHYRGLVDHPFPTCFACGPVRVPADGLDLRTGPVGGDGVHAAAWVPSESSVELVWAALDCPGAWALGVADRPMVLGTMTAQLHALPSVAEPHVVMAWARGSQGRKHHCGTALYAEGGRLLAVAEATWIAVDPQTIRPVGGRP